MALIVEDNTGLATAEAYVSVVAFRAYCAARGLDTSDYSDEDCEAALRKGFTYVNANWRYKSAPKSNDQAGEFPRIDLSDGMGRVFNTVPQRAKDANCEAGFLALTADLFTVAERGGQVASESVGPISVSYQPGAPAEKLFGVVQKLLAPFVRDSGHIYRGEPSFNGYDDTPPVFSVGMDDTPGIEDGL